MKLPVSTYRLQLNKDFPFSEVEKVLPYFEELGVSWLYFSPILKACPESTHGYDVIDHSQINPELGTDKELEELTKNLKEKKMGILLDIVPNHMCLNPLNPWVFNLLESGRASPYAKYFHIDWRSPVHELTNKILFPVLSQPYWKAIENQDIQTTYDNGAFFGNYGGMKLPICPETWNIILEPVLKLASKDPNIPELESIITSLKYIPKITETNEERIHEREREKEIVKKRLNQVCQNSPVIAESIRRSLEKINGIKGDVHSFDLLEHLLNDQAYRLCNWKVGNDEINYRRFFDVNSLIGVRVEDPDVFHATHRFILNMISKRVIQGLRIDHIDGLFEPAIYLETLQSEILKMFQNQPQYLISPERPYYIVVEKVLSENERLNSNWPVFGTTGYEFLNALNGIFVKQENKDVFYRLYSAFTGYHEDPTLLRFQCKKTVLHVSMSSELYVLARQLDRIAEQHRTSREYTLDNLRNALRDVIASFPVYRSYIGANNIVTDEDRYNITTAVRIAKQMNPAISTAIFNFIQSVLLLEHPEGLDESQKAERKRFVMAVQQLTGPVMAKGLEDTAFYQYYPLASLNEVGGSLSGFGISLDDFHVKNRQRLENWPYTLLATSTHDTKRGEDVRARINVLSEIPEEWQAAFQRWHKINYEHKVKIDEALVPDNNEEYLFYQTLVGTWPIEGHYSDEEMRSYIEKINKYMLKALREAKIHTSWINSNEEYDKAISQFISSVLKLDAENPFLSDFKKFMPKIMHAGICNSLSQTAIKFSVPGVPDLYQGSELWNFSLVDPDNRQKIDFEARRELLKEIVESNSASELIKKALKHPETGQIKQYITQCLLKLRHAMPELFLEGEYLPIKPEGELANHLFAFQRKFQNKELVFAAARFFIELNGKNWKGTYLPVSHNDTYKELFTKKIVTAKKVESGYAISMEDLFNPLTVAVLQKVNRESL